LNEFLRIDQQISNLGQQVNFERASVENQVNAIGSRSHIFGGSGEGLLLSFLFASSAVKQDERAIQALQAGHAERTRRALTAVDEARITQEFLEFRAKTAASVLLVACGKAASINVPMPAELERYVLGQ
jgi:hypothetical protein